MLKCRILVEKEIYYNSAGACAIYIGKSLFRKQKLATGNSHDDILELELNLSK